MRLQMRSQLWDFVAHSCIRVLFLHCQSAEFVNEPHGEKIGIGLLYESVIFLGMRPASCTHNFARGRKKLASVSPVDS